MSHNILNSSRRWELSFEKQVLLSQFYRLKERKSLFKSQSDQVELSGSGQGPALPAWLSYTQHPAQVEMGETCLTREELGTKTPTLSHWGCGKYPVLCLLCLAGSRYTGNSRLTNYVSHTSGTLPKALHISLAVIPRSLKLSLSLFYR